jgi:hypothetical protein
MIWNCIVYKEDGACVGYDPFMNPVRISVHGSSATFIVQGNCRKVAYLYAGNDLHD